ncbi:hypothetical protein EKO27_g8578 [Xylaria grammica]|uniref:Phosphoribulokinase/uridine kinase domain-containing protein n=1 Tax=Xylaria grammica TaxID=363999 RepID=A0A439CWH3_9PEZI|nr:hypothetical protein EKO27_g8578 [Xylaria grammica]
MDAIYRELADRVVELCHTESARSSLQLSTTQRRVLIGLAGPPGSGKSTVAVEVARRVEQAHSRLKVAVVSLDGFHLTLAVLNARPDAEVTLARRGAPWTFDGVAAVQLVQRLKETFGVQSVIVPTFDHAAKDLYPKGWSSRRILTTDYNDMPNGRYVMERSVGRYDRLVTSLEEHG